MNPETIKRNWQRQDELAVNEAITALLQHSQGRKFLWWLLQIGRVGAQPFSGNALTTAFSCGELNVGNQVLTRLITNAPEGYITMMKEQADERSRRDAELDRAAGGTESGYYGDGGAESESD